jgi:hypothetical protein
VHSKTSKRCRAKAAQTQTGGDARTHPDAVCILQKDPSMNMTLSIGPLAALIAGILILIVPRLLNYIVAIYLIIIGLLGLFGAPGSMHFR